MNISTKNVFAIMSDDGLLTKSVEDNSNKSHCFSETVTLERGWNSESDGDLSDIWTTDDLQAAKKIVDKRISSPWFNAHNDEPMLSDEVLVNKTLKVVRLTVSISVEDVEF